MKTTYNKEKFIQLVSQTPSRWAERHNAKKVTHNFGQNGAIIAINVLTLLEEKNWSQEQLAQIMNISPKEVSKIVKGKVNFSIELIAHLEKAFGKKIKL